MTRNYARVSFPFVLATVVGCAASANYLYAPQDARYWSDGYPTTAIAVPPEAPQGKVEVTSFGITEIKPDGAGPVTVLHVRLAISNDGDVTPWTLTTTDQLVEIAGEGRSRPLFVNTDVKTLPTVTIGQRERRVLDFYFPLPVSIRDEENLPGFDVLWQVTTPARRFASRTRFQRLEQEPPPPQTEIMFWSGWGPYWWYDGIYRGPRVIVSQPPRAHYRAIRDHRR